MSEGDPLAADPGPPPLLRVGSVLSRSFGIWFRNLIPFTLLAIVFQSPVLLYAYLKISELPWNRLQQSDYEMVTTWGVRILGFILSGAVAYGVFHQLQGERAGFLGCFLTGLRRLGPIVITGTLATLCIFVPGLALIFFGGHFLYTIAGSSLAVFLVGIVVVVVAIIAATLFVTLPVVVVERQRTWAALGRSAELTRGARGEIFVVMLVIGVLVFGFGLVIGLWSEGGAVDPALLLWLELGVGLLFSTLFAVSSAVAYHDLRTGKEGVAISELMRVFE